MVSNHDRYQRKDAVGSGGMKVVYRVHDKATGRDMAMAMLHEHLPPEIEEAFILEAKLTSHLEHPNIIAIHDIGYEENERPYYIMDLKIGDSLEDLCQRQKTGGEHKVSITELLNIFLKICDAMSYAHSKAILHLDLKPDNIQIGHYGEVLVCDWGLGKVTGNPSTTDIDALSLNPDFINNVTLTGHIKGTPGYMAPEQVMMDGDKSPATDIYALGAILHRFLTHEPPITGELMEILEKTKQGKIPPPHQAFPHRRIPQRLSQVISKALALKPEDRYASVDELKNDVYNYMMGYSTLVEDASWWTEFKLFIRRNLLVSSITGMSSLLGAILSIWFIVHLKASRDLERSARLEAEKNLNMYLEQKQQTEKARTEVHEQKLWTADYINDSSKEMLDYLHLLNTKIFSHPEAASSEALTKLDALIQGREQNVPQSFFTHKATLHFIRQEFRAFLDTPHAPTALKKAISPILPVQDSFLKAHAFKRLAQNIKFSEYPMKRALLSRMLSYHGAKLGNLGQHVGYVRTLLALYNPKWDPKGFDHSVHELRLQGKELKSIGTGHRDPTSGETYKYLFFRDLGLKVLNIEGTSIVDRKVISSLPQLRSLNIRNTPIRKSDFINVSNPLKTLYISSGQLNREELAKIPPVVNIIEK